MKSLVITKGITKSYGEVRALTNVDLNIPKGAIGLLGPNGAGKSTLIRTLIGLLNADSGTGRVFGLDISSEGLEIRKRIGYMPEHECLIMEMTAVEMVAYSGQVSGMPRGDAKQRAHEVLHFVGFGDERYRKIGTYSSGMKQKVNLAQALVHDPEALFLDEPTSGLDPKGRVEMLELLKYLARVEGKSVLLSSHILPDVEFLCDHLVVLSSGQVLMQGGLKEKLRGEAGVMNARIAGDASQFIKDLKREGFTAEDQDGYLIRITQPKGKGRTEEEMFGDIIAVASGTGVQVRYLSASAMNLEDLFMEIVESSEGGVVK